MCGMPLGERKSRDSSANSGEKLVDSDVKAELLVFFYNNPGAMDTVEGIARRVGRGSKIVERNIVDLLELGFLNKRQVGSREIFALNYGRYKDLEKMIVKYVDEYGRLSRKREAEKVE